MTFVQRFTLVSRTKAYPELYKDPPPNKLIAWRPIFSLLGHLALLLAFQVLAFYYVKWQPWFEAFEDSDDEDTEDVSSYENTAVFCVAMFQYISEAIVLSKGAPYRGSIFSNSTSAIKVTRKRVKILNL